MEKTTERMFKISAESIELLQQTEHAFCSGKHDLAYKLATDLLGQHPLCVRLLLIAYRSGFVLDPEGEEHLQYLEAAVELDPNNSEVRLAYGRYLLAKCGDTLSAQSAINEYREALRLAEITRVKSVSRMGYLLGYTQRSDEAQALISRLESSLLITGDDEIEALLADMRLSQWE